MPRIKQIPLVSFWIALLLVSMVYSKFLLSVSMIGLVFSALFPISEDTGKLHVRPQLKERIGEFFGTPLFSSLILLVVAYLMTGFYSEDIGEWFWRVRTKSPFLFLPLAFFLLSPWDKAMYDRILAFFVILMSLSSGWIMIDYLLHQEEMVELLRVGQAIPTPCHHIRYSLMLAIGGVISAYYLLFNEKTNWRWLWIAGLILLTVALHIMSVRTGILAFYMGLGWLALHRIFSRGGSVTAFAMIALILAAPFVAYKTMPSFKQKIDYVKYDMEQFVKDEGQNYSDSERIMSLQAGWHIFSSHPVFGVGIGDLRAACTAYYQDVLGREKSKFPHNQFLFVLAGCGIVGALIFFTGFFWPLFVARPIYRPMYIAIYLILIASLMVENTIETAVGTAVTIFWIILFVRQDRDLTRHDTVRSHGDRTTA